MKNKWILVAIGLSALFASCQQEEIDAYEMDESKVYFQTHSFSGANGAEGYSTTTFFSFMSYPLNFQNVVFRGTVQLLGEVKDYDRSIRVVVDEEETTMAPEGYEIDLDTLKIKAGTNKGEVGVRFFRTESILEKPDTLVLRLEENEYFHVLQTYKSSNVWDNTTAGNLDGSRYTFVISEVYTRPDSWSKVQRYFGDWSRVRHSFIDSFFGFSKNDWDFWGGVKLSDGRMPFYARELQKELQRRADAGEPVYDGVDEEGKPNYMQLPDPYRVNY